ncbi:proteasome assembly chaperone 1 [Paramormyrops kingsleyae]|uniref:Proteasome assembly chaperone 1 n=1 Tax=Paramormyrops kingsleyae TaxID=1676925 RepID=A0A3B3SXD9_9TELE|nr:proteasome assembly chaperone 1 [Paramormyrops kingsleyae]
MQMATFFGEVLSVYSRAVEEDEEDDHENEEDQQIRSEIEEKRKVHVEWCSEVKNELATSAEKGLHCSDLVVAVGPNAAGFLSAYVLSSEIWSPVGSVSIWNERNPGSGAMLQSESSCVFYRQKDSPSVLICQCTCYIAEDQLFQWAESVFSCIEKRGLNVTVLSDCSLAEFKTTESMSSTSPFLRALKTGLYRSQISCPLLEQPNIVTGLAAAVVSHCQVHQIPAVLYQSYSDVITPDSVTMETYKPAFLNLSRLIKLDANPNADVLKKLIRISDPQSNMYT